MIYPASIFRAQRMRVIMIACKTMMKVNNRERKMHWSNRTVTSRVEDHWFRLMFFNESRIHLFYNHVHSTVEGTSGEWYLPAWLIPIHRNNCISVTVLACMGYQGVRELVFLAQNIMVKVSKETTHLFDQNLLSSVENIDLIKNHWDVISLVIQYNT